MPFSHLNERIVDIEIAEFAYKRLDRSHLLPTEPLEFRVKYQTDTVPRLPVHILLNLQNCGSECFEQRLRVFMRRDVHSFPTRSSSDLLNLQNCGSECFQPRLRGFMRRDGHRQICHMVVAVSAEHSCNADISLVFT